MKRRSAAASYVLARALPNWRGFAGWDPVAYAAEIATIGIISAVLMLVVIALR